MIILAKKDFDEVISVLVVVLVISLSVLFSILTQYGLKNITGFASAITQANIPTSGAQGIQIVLTSSTPPGASNYNLVDFGNLFGGDTKDTTGYISISSMGQRPIIVRNVGNEPLDVQIQATQLWTDLGAISTDYQFKVGNPGISDDIGLDTCGTTCFDTTGSATSFTNMPIQPTPATNAINNLRSDDANDEARVDIKIHVPINQQGLVSSTVTVTGTYCNVIPGGTLSGC